jgi:ATP-dependent RNA helicase HelY
MKKTGASFPSGNFKRPRIKPGVDPDLRKIFTGIGVPRKRPFVPDPFQIEAVSAARDGDCLVTAPTGSGKTWIALQTIAGIFSQGGRSWYASPLKALSNAKFMEFGETFGTQNVGILTGDRKENPDAPIIIGTTEVLRNQLYDAMHKGETLPFDFVVLDEAHFLGDEERGVVWEETIIYLPARIPILLLSATIGNADEIARWITSIRHKSCAVIQEFKRPVPLVPILFHPTGTLFPLLAEPGAEAMPRIHKKISGYLNSRRPLLLAPPNRLPPFGDMLQVLKKYRLLPAIFFLKSRADCDHALEICAGSGWEQNENANEQLAGRLEELVLKNPYLTHHRQLWHLRHLAMGSHHSGQLPIWKLVLEKLMTEGLLDAIFATSTVAAGVNFPARSIVMLNSDRFNGRDFSPLTPTEFHQMAGRAGRRGMDKVGFAVLVPGKFMDIKYIAKVTGMPPSPVNSQIRINFSMVLNLLLSHTPDQIEDLLSKCFAAFQIHQKKKKKGASAHEILVREFNRHLSFLKNNEFVTPGGDLTDDGLWASRLRVDHPLIIAEGFRQKAFPENDPALLAGVVALFVNEDETDENIETVFVPNKLVKVFKQLKKRLRPFSEMLAESGFATMPFYLRPMATVYAWAAGYSWDKVLPLSELEPGSLVMLILRTADNLRHIMGLKEYFPEASSSAQKALDLILKDPVITEDS